MQVETRGEAVVVLDQYDRLWNNETCSWC